MKRQNIEHRAQNTDNRLQTFTPSLTLPPRGGGMGGGVSQVLRSEKGLTLIEVLVALTILAIGLLGVALMQITSITGNVFSKEMAVATELGQDMLEKLRTMEYTAFTTDNALLAGTHPDATDVANNLAPAPAGSPANIVDERGLWPAIAATLGTTTGPLLYTRIWTVADVTPTTDMKTITVTVSWLEKGVTTRSITLTGVKVRE